MHLKMMKQFDANYGVYALLYGSCGVHYLLVAEGIYILWFPVGRWKVVVRWKSLTLLVRRKNQSKGKQSNHDTLQCIAG
ncbi:hypothetical protein ACHAWX_006624 [Stephanocyclus meneghinianus]